jgi:restriction system-associated AAA family ATPase
MKLLRLKINDPAGFRSLSCGFEHYFRTESSWQDELDSGAGFSPFVCAGPNGSGKSNLLEVLAAIFYQLEVQRVRRSFLPSVFEYDPEENPSGIQEREGSPNAYELEYLIQVPEAYRFPHSPPYAYVRVLKQPDESPWLTWVNHQRFATDGVSALTSEERDFLLPEYVLGYSSGENELLSLPFFKMRFVQFDEYWTALRERQSYPGHPETRLTYLDSSFSQAILLCNLLFPEHDSVRTFTEGTGIEALKQFRIILRRGVPLSQAQAVPFMAPIGDMGKGPGSLVTYAEDSGTYRLDVLHLLRDSRGAEGAKNSSLVVDALRRCATLEYVDEASDSLVLDFWVNEETRKAFAANFDKPRMLFQALQVLLTLNLYTVSDSLKADLYRSNSEYVRETIPTLASDERVMRFKHLLFRKQGVERDLALKNFSDGEHQLLHSLGLCLLFAGTQSLFLLDEPETHFNPSWRASFITRLGRCLNETMAGGAEMLVTTHSPFLVSDSTPDKTLMFSRDAVNGMVRINHPTYNTLGASINKITMLSFGKYETVGGRAETMLKKVRNRFERGENPAKLVDELDRDLGDSVEKVLLINAMLGSDQSASEE